MIYAAALIGKVPINLNYTASNELIAASAQQSNLRTVITSKAFLEKLPHLKPPGAHSVLKTSPKTPAWLRNSLHWQ